MSGSRRTPEEAGPLLPALTAPGDREAIRCGGRAITYRELAGVVAHVSARIAGATRVAVWASPVLETCAAVVAALAAAVPIVPINPRAGEREPAHTVSD